MRVMPVASAPRISARCEIDLSPGTRNAALERAGWRGAQRAGGEGGFGGHLGSGLQRGGPAAARGLAGIEPRRAAPVNAAGLRPAGSSRFACDKPFDKAQALWQIARNSPLSSQGWLHGDHKQDRGTKRTCQNGECGARFYDLNRSPITCPICGASYVIASSPMTASAPPPEEKAPRKPKKEEFVPAVAEEAAGPEEELADVEADETVADDEDETFLEEEEEEGGDVSNIIGGPVKEGEEEP